MSVQNTEIHPIYNLQFFLVCFSSLLFSASFNMLIPELPDYLTSLGGAEYKGLIIGLFTITAGISRPFSGKLTDKIGRVPIMAIGSIVCFVCSLLYPILTTVAGFLVLRLLHGFSTGFKPTATAAYVADIVPKERWGEALGLHGICFSTGMAIGPAVGSTIKMYTSMNFLFYTSALFALLSIIILLNMKETLKEKKPFSFSLFKISAKDVFDVHVLPAALVTFLSYVAYGVILTLIPDWTGYLGIENKGMFFMIFTISSLLIRFFAGKVSDTYGRTLIIKIGLVILTLSLVVLAYFKTVNGMYFGAFLYGISLGVLSPALNAWTIDFSSPDQRGRAISTMYVALEAGIGGGAFLAGWYYSNKIEHIPTAIFYSALVVFSSLIYMLLRKDKKKLTA